MKTSPQRMLLLSFVLFLLPAAAAQSASVTLFSDDFSSGVIDGAKWTVYNGSFGAGPHVTSSHARLNDSLDAIRTVEQFDPNDYQSLTVSFRSNAQYADGGHIQVALRSDIVSGVGGPNSYGNPSNGLSFTFYTRPSGVGTRWRFSELTGGSATSNSSFPDNPPAGWAVSQNDVIDFAITITANTWSVVGHNVTKDITASWNGVYAIAPGVNHVSFGGTDNVTLQFTNVLITAVPIPEPASCGLVGAGLLGLAACLRRSRWER